MKRFYKMVSRGGDAETGYRVELDGRPVKTPSGAELMVPTEKLADLVVAEWAAQGENIIPDTMKHTQILTTAQDQRDRRYEIKQGAMAYFNTDLLCYRTETPETTLAKQKEIWDPWLEWFEGKTGHKLETTNTLNALVHPPEAHDALGKKIDALDEYRFAVFHIITAMAGSIILAAAFIEGEATPENVYECANLEEELKAEIYNEDFYGKAPHQEKAQDEMKKMLRTAREFLDAL